MLRNILSPEVPGRAALYAREVFDAVTARAGVGRERIAEWIFHAGGREVLQAMQAAFGLPDEAVRHSAEILEQFGNLSSPFVLFALKAALENNSADGLWWLTSFGAGFCCHGALLEVA
jgi:alkylresorcinol/alkylpyrone synthase